MSLTSNLLQGGQQEWALLKRHPSEDIFGIQVTGNHPNSFAKLCDVLQQTVEMDFLDINLGCPVEAITSRGCGSALMERKNKLRGIIAGAVSILDCPVTVKLRTGIHEDKLFAHKLIPMFQDWGVSAVTLHGRTKAQRYTKLASWDYINECSSMIDRTDGNQMYFIGNGDIFNPNEYLDTLRSNQNLDGIMIGRGALIKPWIFKELKTGILWDISANERLDMLKDFAKYGMEHWGTDTMGINQTRRFLCEGLSFFHRYVPVGLIEVLPQKLNLRAQRFVGRNELETLMASDKVNDWIKLTEMVLGPVDDNFSFIPKHKSTSLASEG
jgi:tRNA-dihydrouridine synthase 3